VTLATGLLALGVVIYIGKLWGQTAPPQAVAPAEPRTRIALLNLNYVIKKYQKFEAFQAEIKRLVAPFQAQDQQWKQEGERLAKQAQTPNLPGDQRDAIERQLKDLQRKAQDNKDEFNRVVGRKQEEQLKILYMDVQDTAQRYAMAHNFELVLHYNDATTKEDFWSGANIARKIQAGACMPLYAAPGMDISEAVVTTLNGAYSRSAQVPAAAPVQGPGAVTPASAVQR